MLESQLTQAETDRIAELCSRLSETLKQKIVGQSHLIERLIESLMVKGHVLLEGLPGLAKTTAVKVLSAATHLEMNRVQFAPDLLPADIIGTQVYDPRNLSFVVKKGPVFTNFLLADEINRAPAKVQSALLQAMEERQVTIGEETFKLSSPFLVLATQNPIEQAGTYTLPEAQLDRFLFKLKVSYGTPQEEEEIVRRASLFEDKPIVPVLNAADIEMLHEATHKVFMSDKIRTYLVKLVFATREPQKYGLTKLQKEIAFGASPRASIALERVARAHAILKGRSYVIPQDIKDISHDILRHRIILNYEADAEGRTADDVVTEILAAVDVP